MGSGNRIGQKLTAVLWQEEETLPHKQDRTSEKLSSVPMQVLWHYTDTHTYKHPDIIFFLRIYLLMCAVLSACMLQAIRGHQILL